MAKCEYLIAQDIQANCAQPIFTGLEPIGYIINRNDIKGIVEADGKVSSISLKTGKKAYQIQQMGQQPFNGTNSEMQQGDVMNTVNKVVSFIVLDNSPSVSEDIIKPMLNGEFVVIIENKYRVDKSENAFEIIGLDKGARATNVTQNKYENNAGWVCELTESETPNPSKFVWDTDYDTTAAMLEALLTTA